MRPEPAGPLLWSLEDFISTLMSDMLWGLPASRHGLTCIPSGEAEGAPAGPGSWEGLPSRPAGARGRAGVRTERRSAAFRRSAAVGRGSLGEGGSWKPRRRSCGDISTSRPRLPTMRPFCIEGGRFFFAESQAFRRKSFGDGVPSNLGVRVACGLQVGASAPAGSGSAAPGGGAPPPAPPLPPVPGASGPPAGRSPGLREPLSPAGAARPRKPTSEATVPPHVPDSESSRSLFGAGAPASPGPASGAFTGRAGAGASAAPPPPAPPRPPPAPGDSCSAAHGRFFPGRPGRLGEKGGCRV